MGNQPDHWWKIKPAAVVSKKWNVSFLQLLYHSTPVMITSFDSPFCFCMRPTAPPPEYRRVEPLKGVVGERQREWWQRSFRRTRDEPSLQGAVSDCLEIETVLKQPLFFFLFCFFKCNAFGPPRYSSSRGVSGFCPPSVQLPWTFLSMLMATSRKAAGAVRLNICML